METNKVTFFRLLRKAALPRGKPSNRKSKRSQTDSSNGKRSPDKRVVWKVRVELSKVVFHVSPWLPTIADEPSGCAQCASLVPLARTSLGRLLPGVQGLARRGSCGNFSLFIHDNFHKFVSAHCSGRPAPNLHTRRFQNPFICLRFRFHVSAIFYSFAVADALDIHNFLSFLVRLYCLPVRNLP